MGDLPPTQYLVMEVLAARWRNGDSFWTFPSYCGYSVRILGERGLVWHKGGIIEGTIRAGLTDFGKREWGLDRPYSALTGSTEGGVR